MRSEDHRHHVIEFCDRLWAQTHYGHKWVAESTAGDMVEFLHGHSPIMEEQRLVVGSHALDLETFFSELRVNEEAMAQFTRLLLP
jgi:hypothetical protein